MDTIYIRAQLQRRLYERQLTQVANGSGVSRYTLYRIARGGNGSVKTLTALEEFLRRTEREKKLDNNKRSK